MTKRFIVDDIGTLIDTQTIDMFDIVKEVCPLLNELHEENEQLKEENQDLKAFNQDLSEELSVCANARISKDNRIERLEEKIQRERTVSTKTHERWSKEAEKKIKELSEENEQLKKVLGAILLEVKRDISNTNQTGEIRVFINPNSFDLISDVLKKYGALKEWYE